MNNYNDDYERAFEDYCVTDYDIYNATTGEYLGCIELPENANADQMPDSLEINGVEYLAQK